MPILPPGSPVHAVYGTLPNTSAYPVTITKVESPNFQKVEWHETHLDGNGIQRMRKKPFPITLPPFASQTFRPGGDHLMLFGEGSGENPKLVFTLEDGQSKEYPIEFRERKKP